MRGTKRGKGCRTVAYSLEVGGVRCHIVSDGLNRIDGGGFFGLTPRVLW